MNSGKRKFASNLMAIIWFIIYLMPVMTFGFYSLGNIGADKVYKDDIFSSYSDPVLITTGDVLVSSSSFNSSIVSSSGLSESQLIDMFGFELLLTLISNGAGSFPYITIDNVSYYYYCSGSFAETFIVYFTLSNSPLEYLSVPFLFGFSIVAGDDLLSTVEVVNQGSFSVFGPVDYILPNLLFSPQLLPSFMDKTFAQFGYDSNNLDIVGQSIVDFGELVNFNGLTANSPATFFIWWFFLVTIVRLLFEIVAFIPKLAVKWLHYFSRE